MNDIIEDGPDDIDPDEVARLCADRMWADERASRWLGMSLDAVGAGYATLSMEVTADMANGHGIAHGGLIFTLADSAFGFACNSRGDKSVAQYCAITFIRPACLGERLVAVAHEVSREGRSGLYDVNVSAGEETVAEFRGHSRTIGGRWVE